MLPNTIFIINSKNSNKFFNKLQMCGLIFNDLLQNLKKMNLK